MDRLVVKDTLQPERYPLPDPISFLQEVVNYLKSRRESSIQRTLLVLVCSFAVGMLLITQMQLRPHFVDTHRKTNGTKRHHALIE